MFLVISLSVCYLRTTVAVSLLRKLLTLEYGIWEINWRQVVCVEEHMSIWVWRLMNLCSQLRLHKHCSTCWWTRRHKFMCLSISLYNTHQSTLDHCFDFVFHYLLDPLITSFDRFRRKNEPSLCIVPVFLTILPQGRVMAFIVIRSKLLAYNLFAEKLMHGKVPSPLVSDCHGMASNDLCFPLRQRLAYFRNQIKGLATLCALRPLFCLVVRNTIEIHHAQLRILTSCQVTFRGIKFGIEIELLIDLERNFLRDVQSSMCVALTPIWYSFWNLWLLQLPPCGVTLIPCICKEGPSILHVIRVLNVDDLLIGRVKLSHFAFGIVLLDLWLFTNQIQFNSSKIASISRWFCAMNWFQTQILGWGLVGHGQCICVPIRETFGFLFTRVEAFWTL